MSKEMKYLEFCEEGARLFSTCAKRQYYAFIVAANGRIAGAGYNGSPPGAAHCVDGHCPRVHEASASGTNYDNCVANHAEANAILYSDAMLRQGATLYVNGTPCWWCAKLIASSGVKRIVCHYDPDYADWPRSKQHLISWGIEVKEVVHGRQ